jgi:hypothetical protein
LSCRNEAWTRKRLSSSRWRHRSGLPRDKRLNGGKAVACRQIGNVFPPATAGVPGGSVPPVRSAQAVIGEGELRGRSLSPPTPSADHILEDRDPGGELIPVLEDVVERQTSSHGAELLQ